MGSPKSKRGTPRSSSARKPKNPPSRRFYLILGIESTASHAEIHKAFRVRALKIHPDKNPDNESATQMFQQLQTAYSVLKDPKKRQQYDLYGCEDEETAMFMQAFDHYRMLFPQLDPDDIEAFASSYRKSEDEKHDLIEFYERFGGDVSDILKWIPLSEASDIDRYLNIINALIKEKRLEKTELYIQTISHLRKNAVKWSRRTQKESKELNSKTTNGNVQQELVICFSRLSRTRLKKKEILERLLEQSTE
ncbi:DnaJ domain-containing protein [Cardiosporidium cionae]|uniref:DnaJ domain-containing protein n=1 Tax=Cardiosporidium cionae TaxID=476202 RepID=A0ABQ7JBA8_9APIC|nr:DnaJ domain-containing protein [Cardiosporidium cionae]|eukprot:KAF8821288.1 DnaJ domain-containing protein [Cardiosporidium cionae]